MLIKKLLLTTFLAVFIIRLSSGQEIRCLTPENEDTQIFENWLLDMKSANSMQRLGVSTYNIPVIVHVIHNGETVGTGSNISVEQVISQFVVLNADFNRTNEDAINTPEEFLPVTGEMDISFVPALIDEAGQPLSEPGIDRVDRNSLSLDPPPYNVTYIDANIKPVTIWDSDKYFNIWVMDFDQALGYAQAPVSVDPGADPNTDGIVVRYSAFGTTGNVEIPWNGGRTTTHEVGHWLGLYHIWGQSPDNACAEDDFVADTPNQDKPSAFCPTSSGTTCSPVTREMWENYMDYTWDACMNLFTSGQVDRMTTVVENDVRRAPLLTSTVGGKYDQEINFGSLADVQYGDNDFNLTASSNWELPITYTSSDATVAVIDGSGATVTIIGAGNTVITASQAGDDLFNPAISVEQTLTVDKADQTINFDNIPTLTYGNEPYDLMATTSSGLVVFFTTSEPTIADISGNALSIISAGSVTISAMQPGNENYNNAPQVEQVIEILKANQMITFEPVSDKTYGDPDIVLRAESDSGLPVEKFESSDSTVIKVIDSTAVITGAGIVVLTAIQEGDQNYKTASDSISITVQKAAQNWIISGVQDYQDSLSTIPIMVETNSGQDISYVVDPEILIYDSIWSVLGAGKVNIEATQTGGEFYHPTDTSITFCILPSPVIKRDTINKEIILSSTYAQGNTWTFPDATVLNDDSINADQIGEYILHVDIVGCQSSTSHIVDQLVPLVELLSGLELKLYPNPATHSIFLEYDDNKPLPAYFRILDLTGKQLTEFKKINQSAQKIDINHIKSGVYFLNVIIEGSSFSIRFVKE